MAGYWQACGLTWNSQVRFLNSNLAGNNINSEQAALQLVGQVNFSGKSSSFVPRQLLRLSQGDRRCTHCVSGNADE